MLTAARDEVAQIAGNLRHDGAARRSGDCGRSRSGQRSRRSSAALVRRFRGARIGASPSQPNYNNQMMSNFGCAVNSNLAAMRSPILRIWSTVVTGASSSSTAAGTKAVNPLPDHAADGREGPPGSHCQGEASNERSVPGTRRSARSLHRLRLRRCHCRHASAGCGRARLVAGEGQQGRSAQRRPVAVGLGKPEHPVRRSQRIRRPAERHQRACGSLRAGNDRDRCRAPSTTCACIATSSPAASTITC